MLVLELHSRGSPGNGGHFAEAELMPQEVEFGCGRKRRRMIKRRQNTEKIPVTQAHKMCSIGLAPSRQATITPNRIRFSTKNFRFLRKGDNLTNAVCLGFGFSVDLVYAGSSCDGNYNHHHHHHR